MAILDTLTIQLSMDGTGLTKGVKEAEGNLKKVHESAEKSTDTLVESGKKGADTFAAFRQEAMGALALFTGGAGIAAFTKDISRANTALGSLSRQLDIAPQKLTQLHETMKATGANEGSVDNFLTNIQNKASTNEGVNQLKSLGLLLNTDFIDKNNNVRADIFDQLAHSKTAQSLNRGVLSNYIRQAGGDEAVTNLVTRKDYDGLKNSFANIGPTPDQVRQGEQLLADWTELKANTNQVMQQVFSDLEPSIHQFMQALITLEKAHPDVIAEGIEHIAVTLTALSAILTARSFLTALKAITGAAGGGSGGLGFMPAAMIAETVGEAVKQDVKETGHAPDDPYAGAEKTFFGVNTEGVTAQESHISDNDARKHWEDRTGLPHFLAPADQADLDSERARIVKERRSEETETQSPSSSPTQIYSPEPTPSTEAGKQQEPVTTAYHDRGIRNNNPGNLRFVHQNGATPENFNDPKHSFAVFKTATEGLMALKTQISLYNGRDHLDTVRAIISKYAPPNDNNKTKDYIHTVSHDLKVGEDQHLGKISPRVMAALMHGIIRVENSNHDPYGQNVERIAGLMSVVPVTSSQVTHHNTHTTHTHTHSPTINIAVNGTNNHPEEVGKMAYQGTSDALQRYQGGRVG
ncbi:MULTISPECIES: hypothetical protein [unclassified Saccharibacter]|uniref:hypothetical protein n=1 Tax=unclassified Saccharibacter TaxID=2648722 RepID=UPI001925408B|nr:MULTISPECIES: hypothetical protein [unclassified Saccharibacter]